MSGAANKKIVVKRKVPMTIMLRDYPTHERFKIVTDSIIHEGGDPGDAMDAMLCAVEKLSRRIRNPQHRVNVANSLAGMAVDLKRVDDQDRASQSDLVTHYPTEDNA